MNKLIKLTSAVALAVSTVAVSTAHAAQPPSYAPPMPFAMGAADQETLAEQNKAVVERQATAYKQAMEAQRQMAERFAADQEKLATQHKAFTEHQAAAFKQAMDTQQKFAEQVAAEQARMMEEQNRAMEAFFQEQTKLNEQYSASAPGPFVMPEMPASHAFPEMPKPPAFEEFASMDPEARRTAMAKYRDELREPMKQRRNEMRKQMDDRRAQARQAMQERRASIAKERVRHMDRDV